MKIGILTHALTGNYGGILQNFAMQTVLRELGHTPITIDYTKPLPLAIKLLSMCKRCAMRLIGRSSLPTRGWMTDAESRKVYANTRAFVNKYIATTQPVNIDEVGTFDGDFEALLVGSDQVWRYKYLGNEISHFFGVSMPKTPIKVAYAASFGTDKWEMPESLTAICKQNIHTFNAVSVREDSGVKLCRNYLDIPACLVLDPTMLVAKGVYEDVLRGNENKSEQTGMLATYVLDATTEKQEIVKLVASHLGCDVMPLAVTATFDKVGRANIESCVVPPVEEWLSGISESAFVITDSFHGTAFSIIFNKPFLTVGNKGRGLSRMTSLLNMFGLEARLVQEFDEHSILEKVNNAIDWASVNEILETKRAASLEFLRRGLNDPKGEI